jgi:hypothetical protein
MCLKNSEPATEASTFRVSADFRCPTIDLNVAVSSSPNSKPGRPMVGTIEFGDDPTLDDAPLTLDELRDSLRRVLGDDLSIEQPNGPGPHALRRINGQNTRQASR